MVTTDLIATGLPIGVRPGNPEEDAIDGLVAAIVLEPQTAEAVAASLAWASRHRLSVIVRGGGTKCGWGRPPQPADVILSTRRLTRVLAHQHGDLTATVEAGLPLGALNRLLAERGQQLPLDPPFAEAATIGGVVATNDSGPLRHRYGTPRDLIIGVELATADGRLAKAGGQVVKNVAGYDLSKLVSGSFGSLAVIVSATFKLAPLPAACRTVVAGVAGASALHAAVASIASSQLEPEAFEIHLRRNGREAGDRTFALLRFASLPAVVDAQAADACARLLAAGVHAEVATAAGERQIQHEHSQAFWGSPGVFVRVSWLPANLEPALTTIEHVAGAQPFELVGRAAVGAAVLRIEGDIDAQGQAIERLRESSALGNVVIVRASTELKRKVDVWPARQAGTVFGMVKRAMDPDGILGAGREA